MPITFSDFLTFPFNDGKGVRTNQLSGEFIKTISGDGSILLQAGDNSERTIDLEDVIGAIGSNASVQVVHAAPVALSRADAYVDAGFDWPELIPFLLVQWNPAGNSQHRSFSVVYNPRLGRFPGDAVGLTNAAVGDAPNNNNSTGYAVPHGITVDATRAITAAQADFGKTAANRALVSCSDADLDPTPLVVLAITPAQVGVGPAKERVLQPEVDQTAAAGVTSLVLPADYADFEFLELTVFDPNPAAQVGDRVTDFIRVKTDWLETQTDANAPKLAVLDSDEAGSRQWLTWTPSTRTLDRAVQGSNSARIRISAARLYDTSVTTDAPEGGGLTDAQSAKLGRYPENPAATPAAHLEPYALIGEYATVAYAVATFDTYAVDPGEVMVSPATQSGTRHGVLIGIHPDDSDALEYAEVGLSLRLFDTSDGRGIVAGTAASVSSHAGNTVLLVSISDHTVESFNAGTDVRIEFGNKIAKMLADIDLDSQGVDATARASIDSLTVRMNYLEKRGGATLQLYHLGAGNEQYTQAEFAALTGQNLTITGHIDDPALLPADGRFFLRVTNGAGGHTIKTQGGAGNLELQVFQENAVERTMRNQLTAGTVQFTFQLTAPEMAAIFTDASNDPIDAAFVEFDVGMSEHGTNENDVLAVFYEHLVGSATGLTPEQAAEIQRDGQGIQTALAATRTNAAGIAENAAARWPGRASPTPVELTHDIGAFTLRATLDRAAGSYPAGAHMRIVVGGRNGALVPAVENDFNTPATLAFTLDQATALVTQARNHVVRAELRVYDDDQATNHLATLPLDLPVVQPNTILGWRALAGASPYTVRATDSEFLAELTRNVGGNAIFSNVQVAREQLSAAAKVFIHHTQNPDLATDRLGASFTLSSATALTVTSVEVGSSDWTLSAVYAR